MEIAVLADIHSNHLALETCVRYIESRGITHFLFLGDYVSDCAYPQKTMEIIYRLMKAYRCWLIRGNREEYLLAHDQVQRNDGWHAPSSGTGNLVYTYENLTKDDLAFFEQLEIKGMMELEGFPIFAYCHGSLESSKGNLQAESENAKRTLDAMECQMIVCGHAHKQGTYSYHNKKIIHAGSVGVPVEYDAKTQFVILHGSADGWEEEYIQLDYPKEEAIRELQDSGLAAYSNIWAKLVALNLQSGVDYGNACVRKALALCREERGFAEWSDLNEAYWERAFHTLEMI